MNFEPYFKEYVVLVEKVDRAFAAIKTEYEKELSCKKGCSDCCYALFDLSLIEAIYINFRFNDAFKGMPEKRQELLEKADRADRKIYRIKRDAYRHHAAGKDEVEILSKIGAERVRCPLLNDENLCDLYECRPITCRAYGLPVNIQGMTHTCGLTGFEEKKTYPAIYMDKIQKSLFELSTRMVLEMKSRYKRMGDMLVPLSMALLTEYDEEYLGIAPPKTEEAEGKRCRVSKTKRIKKRRSSIVCRLDDRDGS